ncbi:hypothetical protein [Micavibrio aeruginosavorus]|uniref:hypothetical protein n=1 Tax=Micavibrio aeruginosavorus TaxID=349221 RepID=UPI003F4ACC3B
MSDVSAKSAFDVEVCPKPSIDKRLFEFVTLLDGVVGPRHNFRVEHATISDFQIKFNDRNLQDRTYNTLHVVMNDHGQYSVAAEGPMDFPASSGTNARAVRLAINDWVDSLQKTYNFDCQSNLHRRRCDCAEMLRANKLTL